MGDGYSYDPENPPEPTVEEYCEMDGHSPRDFHEDPATGNGYLYCHCDAVVSIPGGEEHDEYSAACADAIEDYVAELSRRTSSRWSTSIHDSFRFRVGNNLRNKPLEYLLALRRSLDASPQRGLNLGGEPFTDEEDFDFFVLMGVHLDLNGTRLLYQSLHNLEGEAGDSFPASVYRTSFLYTVVTPENLDAARVIADLYLRLPVPESRYRSEYHLQKAFGQVFRLALKRPEAIPQIAKILSDHDYDESGIQLAKAVVAQDTLIPTALIDGAL